MLDGVVVAYFACYAVVNLLLLAVSRKSVRGTLQRKAVSGARERDQSSSFAPMLSLIVPAYNEEVTIVESVRSLLRLDYPEFEIVLVNDGSKDGTLDALKEAFDLVRNDIDYNPRLGTSRIRAFYRARAPLPRQVKRLVLVDKENGGKADAINAGLNVSQAPYVTTMDADTVMLEDALRIITKPILDDPNRMIACGTQVALSNGCRVVDGKLIDVDVPTSWIGRFQVAEYMRSFTQSRTALSELNALLVLSGVFAVFQRETLLEAGGFLTVHMTSRVGKEYCGQRAETVCEDMEVVVRLHRYLLDRGIEGNIALVPDPVAWTEAPEVWRDLGKQRSRWYRGLWEVLWFHRGVLFRRRFKQIGLFALPYQLAFEALAPILEVIGYIVVPLSWAMGILSFNALVAFLAVAIGFNFFLATTSVLLAFMRTRGQSWRGRGLFGYTGTRAPLTLLAAGFLSVFGYRQYLIAWQIKGLRDFLLGRKGWDKFARRGFSGQ